MEDDFHNKNTPHYLIIVPERLEAFRPPDPSTRPPAEDIDLSILGNKNTEAVKLFDLAGWE